MKYYINVRRLAGQQVNRSINLIRIFRADGLRGVYKKVLEKIRAYKNEPKISLKAQSERESKIRSEREKFVKRVKSHQEKGGLVFAKMPIIDWGVPLFQRPQHIASAMARQGALVIYSTSNQYDNIVGYEEVLPNVWVTNDYLIYETIDNALVSIYSTAHFDAYDLLGRMAKKNVIMYEYIDHIDEAISGDGVDKLQRLKDHCFSGGADIVVTSAEVLYEEAVEAVGEQNVCMVANGVDYDHYKKALEAPKPVSGAYEEFCTRYEGKIVGYFGALAPWLWYEMINEVTLKRPDFGFVFIGPDYYGGEGSLEKRSNVFVPGAIEYKSLPDYAVRFDVAIIPFRHGEIARSTSPLKLFEYFALEKPVIVTDDMIECTAYPEVFRAHTASEFITAIDDGLNVADSVKFKSRLRTLALENTWDKRAASMRDAGMVALARKNDPKMGKTLGRK